MGQINVKIEIEKDVKSKIPFNFENSIKKLIKIIPYEHIMNLKEIKVIWICQNKKQGQAHGLYYGDREGSPAPIIILCVGNILKGVPKIVYYLMPWVPELLLSDTLYHEIGHHYQRVSHGYKKEEWEKHAEQYSKMMQKEFLKTTNIGKLLYLIKPFLRKRNNNERN